MQPCLILGGTKLVFRGEQVLSRRTCWEKGQNTRNTSWLLITTNNTSLVTHVISHNFHIQVPELSRSSNAFVLRWFCLDCDRIQRRNTIIYCLKSLCAHFSLTRQKDLVLVFCSFDGSPARALKLTKSLWSFISHHRCSHYTKKVFF